MPNANLSTSNASMVRYKDIPGFPGYRVDDSGGVWSCWIPRQTRVGEVWHLLNPILMPCGHLRLGIGGKNRLVHRIVLEAFVGPCPHGMETRHLDGNPMNNRLENLCWGTREQNWEDRRRHGWTSPLVGERNGCAKLTESQVREALTLVASGLSQREVARRLGVSNPTIGDIIHGRAWRTLVQEVRSKITGLTPARPGRSTC
jgi:hypothetical protein